MISVLTECFLEITLLATLDKKSLSEQDIRTKFITPAIEKAGWDIQTQVREELSITDGRVVVRGKLTSRKKAKRVDYVLYRYICSRGKSPFPR